MSVSIFPDEGETVLLGFIRSGIVAWNFKLFKSNTVPDQSTTLGSLTEANFSGYLATTLNAVDFAVAAEVSNKAVIVANAYYDFIHNGGGTSNTVYGYWIDNGTKIIQIERFDTPQTMADNGDKISIKPRMTLDSES